MPNQRRAGVVNVSFTMPRALADALDQRARMEMTNKSDVVRRAIMAALTDEQREQLRQHVLNEDPAEYQTKKGEPKKNDS